MRLALSAAAAQHLTLHELLDACRHRGLAGLEIVVRGDADLSAAPGAAETLQAGDRRDVAFTAVAVTEPRPARVEELALARSLGVPIVVAPGAGDEFRQMDMLRRHADTGGRVLLMHSTEESAAEQLLSLIERLPRDAGGLAWEIDPNHDDAAQIPGLLKTTAGRLEYIRLKGGGPEAIQQTGLGIGALMARLALARFTGPLVITPSKERYHRVWAAWLGRGGGWGCGSKQSDPNLFSLPLARVSAVTA
jgi:sugar phosphate isomerase/epimerase